MPLMVPEQGLRFGGLVGCLNNSRITRGATNLVTNGGFESNTTGWSTASSATIQRTTNPNEVIDGAGSLKITTQGLTTFEGASFLTPELEAGKMYTFSAKVRSTAGSALRLRSVQSTETTITTTFFTSSGGVDKIVVSFVPSALRTFSLQIMTAVALVVDIIVDDAQLEVRNSTPYIATNGSAASRPASRLSYSKFL